MRPPPRATVLIALAAIAAVALTYFDALRIGFLLDDYLLLRARPWAELRQVWHSAWDITGATPAFYRPLAVWADAGAFAWLGFNERGLHLLALTELAIGAWLIGEFVRRETTSVWLGVYAAILIAVHPAISRSAGPWWYLQNHRLSLIATGLTLLLWVRQRRSLELAQWWPILACIIAGSWLKEDLLLLAPVLLIFQWWRSRTIGDVPAPSRLLTMQVTVGIAIWFSVRWWLLGRIAGTPIGGPDGTLIDQVRHAGRGLWLTFIRIAPMNGPVLTIHHIATALLAAISIVGCWQWRSGASAHSRLLMGYGIAAGLVFNSLVALASSHTRYHLITVGAVLWLVGIAAHWRDARAGVASATWRVVGAMALVCSFALVSRASIDVMRPCTPDNLQSDASLRAWLIGVPAWHDTWGVRWLDDKSARCANGTYLPVTEAIPDLISRLQRGER